MTRKQREQPELPDGFADPGLPKGVFSNTQYSMYKRCGYQYYMRYIQGLIIAPEVAMVRGICVHAGAELVLTEKMSGNEVGLEEAVAHVSDTYDGFEEEVAEPAELAETKDSTLDAYRVFHTQAVPVIEPTAVESFFAIKVGDVPLIGYKDIELLQDGLPAVSDIKVSGKTWTQDAVDKSTQLTLYSMDSKTPDVCIDQVVIGKKGATYKRHTSVRGKQEYDVFTEDVNEVANLIKAGTFPKTAIDSWACSPSWCGYWSECRGKRR